MMRTLCTLLLIAISSSAAAAEPSAPPTHESLAEYQGVYEWEPLHFALIQFWSELGKDRLGFFDDRGEIRALDPTTGDQFSVGPGLATPLPVEATISFVREGTAIRSLIWQPVHGSARRALRVQIWRKTPVSFHNGDVRLAGDLLMPPGKGPFPALVVVHGSGAQDRQALLPFVWFLVPRGFAILLYDKRGVGMSGGDWRRSSFQDLAADAIAGVHFLQARPEIDPKRIGIFGVSQGGWIGPLAASLSSDLAFVVSVSGAGVTPEKETLGFMKNEMEAAGLAPDDVREAAALAEAGFNFARTGNGWDAYLEKRKASESKPWFPFMGLPADREAWEWDFWRLNGDYDPVPVLQKVHCPVLAMFGGRDLNVVAERNAAIWDGALRSAHNDDYTIVILGTGNHVMLQSSTGSIFEFPKLTTFVPGYWRTLASWLCRFNARWCPP